MEKATIPSVMFPVPELLGRDNYERWSIFMKLYLEAHGLLDAIKPQDSMEESDDINPGVDAGELSRKNVIALHALMISCGDIMFEKIKQMDSARLVWEKLRYEAYDEAGNSEHDTFSETVPTEEFWRKSLLESIDEGNWESTLSYHLESDPTVTPVRALHVAIGSSHSNADSACKHTIALIEEIADLQERDETGNTLLVNAIRYRKVAMVKLLIEKSKELVAKRNERYYYYNYLTAIADANGILPVQLACEIGDEHLVRYLYLETPSAFLQPRNGDYCIDLLKEFFQKKMFCFALHVIYLLKCCVKPERAASAILVLAQFSESPFFYENQLVFWKRWLYRCVNVNIHDIGVKLWKKDRLTDEPSGAEGMGFDVENVFFSIIRLKVDSICKRIESRYDVCAPQSPIDRGPKISRALARWLLKLPGLNHIYNLKLNAFCANEVLNFICYYASRTIGEEAEVIEATFQAIKNGFPEFVIKLADYYKNRKRKCLDPQDPERNMFALAVVHRQAEVARFLFRWLFEIRGMTNMVVQDDNNTLHLAAKLAPHRQLARISGAALQLQSELHWYRAVEGIIPHFYKESRNKNRETPFDVFVREHKDLTKEAEEWFKKTAESSTVVAALVLTIMFAAAFTVPGGNNQSTGLPIFSKELSFLIFIVADAISLFTAATSVLMFQGILTLRYALDDFLKSLPIKMVIGISALFISIETMMAAFCAALFIMLQGRLLLLVLITLLAGIPVTSFVLLQLPFFVEIFTSTYRRGIFDVKKNNN